MIRDTLPAWKPQTADDALRAACRKAAYDWYSPFNSQDVYTQEQRIENLSRLIQKILAPLLAAEREETQHAIDCAAQAHLDLADARRQLAESEEKIREWRKLLDIERESRVDICRQLAEVQHENAKLRAENSTEYLRGREAEQLAEKTMDGSWKQRAEAAEAACAAIKRESDELLKSAEQRRRTCENDGLAIQLESEGRTLKKFCDGTAGQSLLDELARLREALRPFAEESKRWAAYGDWQCVAQVPMSVYRRAAAAMEGV